MASSVRNMKLTSVDDLFSSEESRQAERQQQGEQVLTVPISEVFDFANNPYHVRQDAELMDMVESVTRLGVHTPCLARPRKDGGYELLSGHRRKMASILAGKDTLPIIVRDIDDDTATILVVDGNIQRETILPSEKAFAYKMKAEAMRRQAGRPAKNGSQLDPHLLKGKTKDIIAEQTGESAKQIQRYIRLTDRACDAGGEAAAKQCHHQRKQARKILPERIHPEAKGGNDYQGARPVLQAFGTAATGTGA